MSRHPGGLISRTTPAPTICGLPLGLDQRPELDDGRAREPQGPLTTAGT